MSFEFKVFFIQILLFSAVNAVGIGLAYETAINASFPLDLPACVCVSVRFIV